ncbi:hypothetical protein OCV51_12325 [Faecalicatena acetigenes]|uniref:Uncharacterized protein n=1 Tax=Faecalicatena acetigenes TaxID=2981790 RepID=A0ABT2TEK9_9FIRM|nr:hypothetical protein [Faecalicatena acetigenes]MCU6748431.1 hypothetical protein [Faecalicatena acetigenes]SCI43578.1 Uncharacterised protein [uncultured Clostridium sp.]
MRTRKETHIESQEHYNSMVEHPPDPHAYDWLKRPAGVRGLIRQQAEQIEHESPDKWFDRHNIKI